MSIPNIINPYGDLPVGYVVTPAVWNGMFDTIYNYLNNSAIPAINTLIAAPTASVVAQNLFAARLTAVTGSPYPVADTTAGTLFLTAFGGDMIGTYSPSGTVGWTARTLAADISIAVPAATRDLADVFVFWTGSALALEVDLYNSVSATNNPTASAAPVVLNTTSTAMFAVGDVISVTGGGNAEEAVVTAISAGVSITVDSLQFAYTTPVLHSNQPSVVLSLQDQVPVKSTDPTRRYCGTVLIINNQIVDSRTAGRCIGNYYNRAPRPVRSAAAGNYTAVTTYNGRCGATKAVGVERILFVNPFGLASSFSVNRQELQSATTTQKVTLYEVVDNIDTGISGDSNSGANTSFETCGHVGTLGRHVIDDFVRNNFTSTITFQALTDTTNNGNTTLTACYTEGWVLN